MLTFRPDFNPPWTGRAHLTQVTLPRLPRRQVVEMTGRVAHNKTLPPEVVEQVVAKTDGVPLFVEELTKMVLESGLLQERAERYELTGPLPPLAIPTTLHDSLMARLDRLATVKSIAQLGATLGREFSYDLLQAVSPWDEGTVLQGLHQLVEAEFLYQRGLPPQATYLFKHALIQDTAYQSLLKSTRQSYHQRIAQVLEARFPETVASQPELLAYHYTEAGLTRLAMPYWQQAGQRAIERSAPVEAISHLTKGLEVLETLPDTPERAQQELDMQITLGPALMATKGQAALDVERTYARARELCQRVGETPQLFPVLWGLWRFYLQRGELHEARELGERLRNLTRSQDDPARLLLVQQALGQTLFFLGESISARTHLEQAIALYDSEQHHTLAFRYGQDSGVVCRGYLAWDLWLLGYPDQAVQKSHEALARAQERTHPFSLAFASCFAAALHQFRRDAAAVQECARTTMALASEQGFPLYLALGTILWGWAFTAGEREAGILQMQQGLDMSRTVGNALALPHFPTMLAEAYGAVGQAEEGLAVLEVAMAAVQKSQARFYEAEIYRLKGDLLLQHAVPETSQAVACFHHALNVAHSQQAKSLELRAATSLGRRWQQQGKRDEARALLVPIYGWFSEGFDTADLQEAKALLEELGG